LKNHGDASWAKDFESEESEDFEQPVKTKQNLANGMYA